MITKNIKKLEVFALCIMAALSAAAFAACGGNEDCTHEWNDGVVTTAATCTSEGVMTYTCNLCGETKTESIEKAAHDFSGGGWQYSAEGHYHVCATCGEATDEVVAHDFADVEVLQAATETEEGVMSVACAVCGYESTRAIPTLEHTAAEGWTYNETTHWHACADHDDCSAVFDKAAHIWDDGVVTTEATCTEDGIKTYTCTVCGATKTETIESTGHTWDDGVVTTEATCTEDGVKTYTCSACGETYTEEIAATGHNYNTDNIEWTWESDYSSATATFTCTVCSEGTTDHAKTETAIITSSTTAAKCTEDGNIVYTATVTFNGVEYTDTVTVTVAATGHTEAEAVKENEVVATCTEDGSYDSVVYCSVCGEELSRETVTVAATGHSYDTDKIIWTWDSGYSSVTATFTCSSCNGTQTVDADITSETTTEATADENGVKTYTATVTFNNETYTDTKTEPIAATGHNYNYSDGKWTWNGFESATYTVSCTDCDKTVEYKAEITSETTTEATCTTEGVITYTATVTVEGTVYTNVNPTTETIAATGHTAGEAVIENEVVATCTEDGSYDSVVYCSVCGEELSRETVTVEATGHTAGEAVTENEVAATCTEDGSYDSVVYCSVCGEEISRETVTVAATGHSYDYANGVWTWADDGSSATYTATCSNDSSHSYVIDATVTSEVTTSATTNSSGVITYTATVTVGDNTYTATKEISYSLVSADFTSDFSTESSTGTWSYGSITYSYNSGTVYTYSNGTESFYFTAATELNDGSDGWVADSAEIKAGWISAGSMTGIAYTASTDMTAYLVLTYTGTSDDTALSLRFAIVSADGTTTITFISNAKEYTYTAILELKAGDTLYFIFNNEGSGYPQADLSITINQMGSAIADYTEDFSTSTDSTGSWSYGSISYSWDANTQLTYASGSESFSFTEATELNSGSDGWTVGSAEIKAGWISAGSAAGIAYTATEEETVTICVSYKGSCDNTDLSLRIAVVSSSNTVTYLTYAGDGYSLTYVVTLTLSEGDTVYFIFMDDVKDEEKTDSDLTTYYPQADVTITFYEAVETE